MSLLLYPTLLVLAISLFVLFESIQAERLLQKLDTIPPLDIPDPPPLSIIIPALNEEQHIEKALTSVLALDYPRLEIVVLNDRSTDSTPAILDRMAQEHPQLKVIHIQELPPGWLGKNHALHLGAEQAQGDFLLFTDADVHMEPDTIRRAMARMLEKDLDHLSLVFKVQLPNPLLTMLVVDSLSALLTMFKPWRLTEPNSRYYMGAGGFNLIRKSCYQGFGGHHPIRLCPVDDILLGRMVRESDGKMECMHACAFLTVPWYHSVGEMAKGLRKNMLAAADYQVMVVVLASLLVISCNILPFWGLLLTTGLVQVLCGAILACWIIIMGLAARSFGIGLGCLRWFLLTPYIKLYIIWQATLFTLIRGGIEWRGTFYSLDELKQHMVPVSPLTKLPPNFFSKDTTKPGP